MREASVELANWTPVAFSAERGVGWADLRDQRFSKPFFFQSIKDWEGRGGELRWTDVETLAALDHLPSREPDLIIAHASRCGSTLLARLLSAAPGAILVSEPTLLTDIMLHGLAHPQTSTVPQLRQAARALGRRRFGDETRFILKLPSSATRFLPILREALPRSPVVWLQRRPDEILMSELHAPSQWVGGRHGAEPLDLRALRKIALNFMAAKAHVTDEMLVLDYLDLPDAAWSTVAPFMGFEPDAEEMAAMRSVARFNSKLGGPWEPRKEVPLEPGLRQRVEASLTPIYLELDRRRPGARPEASA